MFNERVWINKGSLLLALVFVLTFSSAIVADDAYRAPAGEMGKPVPMTAGTERDFDNTLRYAGTPNSDRTFSRLLHEARLSGNMERVRELEALIPVPEPTGEAAAGTVMVPSTTLWGAGDYKEIMGGVSVKNLSAELMGYFGTDKHVRSTNTTYEESNQTMATDSNGNFYTAWQDASGYIQIYKSGDNGATWTAFGYLVNPDAYLREPSIAVGEGSANVLLVAYIADNTLSDPIPEVATSPLTSASFTVNGVSGFASCEDYAKPVIWTDSFKYMGWYAYLTCEGIVDAGTGNINVCTWRSTTYGSTWGTGTFTLGNTDTYAWTDPDGSYGTTENRSFVVCFNEDDSKLYTVISDDDGISYPTKVAVYTLTSLPVNPVDPEIAAATNLDNVMICCTRDNGSYADCIGQGYSTDAGDTWSTIWPLDGYTNMYEYGAALTANEGGASWHLAYTRGNDHHVMYTRRPQDLSTLWQSMPDVVDDQGWASGNNPKKGIATIWDADICGIVWSDYRDGYPDYDTYFDLNRVIYVPKGPATIQGAIDAASDGFNIFVDPGTYNENINFLGKTITVQSTGGALNTVIDGGDAGSVVTFNGGEGYNTVLRGFHLTNGNYASGGGVFCNGTSPRLENLVITDCYATYGGAIFCWSAMPTISFCTIRGNHATIGGGGLYTKGTGYPFLQSTILWDDVAPAGMGPEIFVEGGNILVVSCDVEGGWTGPGSNNIDDYPYFANPAIGDFHLSWLSPCINRGSSLGGPAIDFEGDARPYMSGLDIGADEFTGQHSFEADTFELSVTGGVVNFDLFAGPSNAGRYYLILGSLSGTNPGTPLPGGKWLPVNWDAFTDVVISHLNTTTLQNFLNVLDGAGRSTARINLTSINPNKVGKKMAYAFCLEGTPDWNFVSNALWVEFVP